MEDRDLQPELDLLLADRLLSGFVSHRKRFQPGSLFMELYSYSPSYC